LVSPTKQFSKEKQCVLSHPKRPSSLSDLRGTAKIWGG
jgi:hypothetical protein